MPRVPHGHLIRDIGTDVPVIGAGISGAMVAGALSVDHQVVIIDRRGPVKGSTPASTALVEYEIDTPLINLADKIGEERAVRAWQRSNLAVGALAARTRALDIRCDLEQRDSLYLAGDFLDPDGLRRESEARRAAGIETLFLSRQALMERFGIRRSAALLAYDDFTMNPRRFTGGYLRAACRRGARIFAPVESVSAEAGRSTVMVKTAMGPVITARAVIYCTGYELPDFIPARGHRVASTYALATRRQPRRLWPERCLIWEASEPYLYIRDTPDGRVLCGGEDEDFSDAKSRDALMPLKMKALSAKLAKLLPGIDARPEFTWAGAFGTSDTGLPSIGPIPGMKNCWAVLGFGGNGITCSRIAADVISAAFAGRSDPDADLYGFPHHPAK
jgi:glycine/D-amino acid oxidase-like deaminating enzyme